MACNLSILKYFSYFCTLSLHIFHLLVEIPFLLPSFSFLTTFFWILVHARLCERPCFLSGWDHHIFLCFGLELSKLLQATSPLVSWRSSLNLLWTPKSLHSIETSSIHWPHLLWAFLQPDLFDTASRTLCWNNGTWPCLLPKKDFILSGIDQYFNCWQQKHIKWYVQSSNLWLWMLQSTLLGHSLPRSNDRGQHLACIVAWKNRFLVRQTVALKI